MVIKSKCVVNVVDKKIIKLIISSIKNQSIKYKKSKIISMKNAKLIVKDIFEYYGIAQKPKGKYVVGLIKNSKIANLKINDKMTSVIRWEK